MNRGVHIHLSLLLEYSLEWVKNVVNAALERVGSDGEQKQTYCNENLILIAIVNDHKYFYV